MADSRGSNKVAALTYTSVEPCLSTGTICDRITKHYLYLSGGTFVPGELHRPNRIILL